MFRQRTIPKGLWSRGLKMTEKYKINCALVCRKCGNDTFKVFVLGEYTCTKCLTKHHRVYSYKTWRIENDK